MMIFCLGSKFFRDVCKPHRGLLCSTFLLARPSGTLPAGRQGVAAHKKEALQNLLPNQY
jgi:hypothetical protein